MWTDASMTSEEHQQDWTLPHPQETFMSPPPLSAMQPYEGLSLADMIIFQRPLSKYEFPWESKSNPNYHFLRAYFVLGMFNVVNLIFTPIVWGTNISTIFQRRKQSEIKGLAHYSWARVMPRTCEHTPSLPVSQCFCLFLHMSSLLQPPGLCLSCSLCRGCPFSNLHMVATCLSGLNWNVTLSASPSLSTLSHPPVLILHLASNCHLLYLQSPACLLACLLITYLSVLG